MFKPSCTCLRTYFSWSCPSWFLWLFSAALLSTGLKRTEGLKVTSSGQQTTQKAEGEDVILDCRYRPSPLDTGELDIEWSVVSLDTTKKDRMLVSYTSGSKYHHGDQALAEGLCFAAGDPSKGDASLSITRLSPAHSATYQCKVKKSPGVDMLKMSLVVMGPILCRVLLKDAAPKLGHSSCSALFVKPSEPECWLEGGELIGAAVSLRCQSAQGSTPLKYKWRRESRDPMPAAATQDDLTGELRISNLSQSFAGIYLCEVNNAVGAERCRINLKASKPPNRAGVIVGNIVGSVLLIFIFMVFIVLLYWKLRSRCCYEMEFSNEIREDAPPPDSRPVSRLAGQTFAQRTRATFCQLDSSEVGCTHHFSSDSHGQTPVKYTAAEYDSRYAV